MPGKYAEVHHAPAVTRGADAPAFAGIGHKVVMPAVITPETGQAAGEAIAAWDSDKTVALIGSGG